MARITTKINLSDYIPADSTCLVGQVDGDKVLKLVKNNKGNLRALEIACDTIEIIIPYSVITMNKSFFRGVLAQRVLEIGYVSFINKYKITHENWPDTLIPDKIKLFAQDVPFDSTFYK